MKLSILLVLASCGGATTESPVAPVNTSTPAKFQLPADADLGWLAIAPRAKPDGGSWIPAGDLTALVPASTEIPIDGGGLAIDHTGKSTRVIWAGLTNLPYGCDNNSLAVAALASLDNRKLAPGAVWVASPAAGKPTALRIESKTASESRRHYAIGPVALDLVRTGDDTGTIATGWRGSWTSRPFKRVVMDGADKAPIKLDDDGEVAVPVPVAAWSFGDDRAALVVFRVPGYEGSALEAFVIGEGGAHRVEPMSIYLYSCAF